MRYEIASYIKSAPPNAVTNGFCIYVVMSGDCRNFATRNV